MTQTIVRGSETSAEAFARIRAYGPDWDGQNANAPFPKAIERAERLVAEETPRRGEPTHVGAMPLGQVSVVWQSGDLSYYLEAEATERGAVEWMEIVDGQPAKHWNED